MSWILALLIGLMAGYGAVSGRETGMLVAALALVVLPVVYYRQGRLRDIGWLFIGLGALPTLLLGPILLASLRDRGTQVDAGTWPAFAVAALLMIVGLLILATLFRRTRGGA
jgi:hypothetical protein